MTHNPATAKAIAAIGKKKPLIIDEADGNTTSFRNAFKIGYSGTSHKNCKGFLKSVMNHALCRVLRERTGRAAFLSAEDLSLMPLVPLHQGFAAVALLNIPHAERNGHHYHPGLSQLPKSMQDTTLQNHPDLYHAGPDGWPTLQINDGRVSMETINRAPFGVGFAIDMGELTHAADWEPPIRP